jgi:hypothetical protein
MDDQRTDREGGQRIRGRFRFTLREFLISVALVAAWVAVLSFEGRTSTESGWGYLAIALGPVKMAFITGLPFIIYGILFGRLKGALWTFFVMVVLWTTYLVVVVLIQLTHQR